MATPEIVITVDASGNTSLDGVNFTGKECDFLQELAKQLGEVVEHQEKPERRQAAAARKPQQVNRNG